MKLVGALDRFVQCRCHVRYPCALVFADRPAGRIANGSCERRERFKEKSKIGAWHERRAGRGAFDANSQGKQREVRGPVSVWETAAARLLPAKAANSDCGALHYSVAGLWLTAGLGHPHLPQCRLSAFRGLLCIMQIYAIQPEPDLGITVARRSAAFALLPFSHLQN